MLEDEHILHGEETSRFAALGNAKALNWRSHGQKRNIICARMASPRNLGTDGSAATKFNDSSHLKNPSADGDREDDSDVLVESRDVYKSLEEEHILRGVNFKIRHGEAVGIIGPFSTRKITMRHCMEMQYCVGPT